MSESQAHTLAVQQLFIRHAGMLKGVVLGLFPDFNLADDVLQEVFLVVTEKAHAFRPGSSFPAWAGEIARRKALEVCRKYRSRQQSLSPEVMELLVQTAPFELEVCSQSDQLRRCVKKLAPKARRIIKMRYRENQKPAEIARELNWQPAAVYVALSRARTFLRECVDRVAGADVG